MRRRGEPRVAAPAMSAAGDDDALIRMDEVVHELAGLFVVHQGADGHLQRDVVALAPVYSSRRRGAALGLVLGLKRKWTSVLWLAGIHNDVAAVAAVAARRTAARDELLPPEGHAAIAAVAGFHSDFGFVNEHGEEAVSHRPPATSLALRSPRFAFAERRLKTSISDYNKTAPPQRGLVISPREAVRTRSLPIRRQVGNEIVTPLRLRFLAAEAPTRTCPARRGP